MESFLMELKKDVQCSLCNDTLTEPKILPCFHIFCKPCIKRHAELIDDVNVFKCPRCKSQTPLPEPSSVEDLKTCILHSRILKGLALVEGEKVCSVSESHSSASWYCFDCDHSLCQECRNYHSFFIKDHKVVRLAELKKEDIEFIITREKPCTNHPQHRLELLCEGCNVMICRTCWIQDHKDHKTMSLEKFAEVKKAVLSKQLQVLEQFELDDKKRKEQEEIATTIKQQGEKARQEVKEKTKKMIQILQENERELLRQIDEKLNAATQNLNIIHHIPAVKEYIEKLMERGLASEVINIHDTPCSEKFIFHSFPQSSSIVINIPNLELLQQVNSGVGDEIQMTNKTDPTMSTILVEGEPEAARQQKLIIRTRTSAGLDSINTGDVVDVHIRPEDDVEIEEKDVRTDGRIEVAFMAKVAGPLTAEVHLNGNPVSNSPLMIDVKPRKIVKTGKFNMYGVNIGFLSLLTGIATNGDNSKVAVADSSTHCVYVFNTYGNRLRTYGSEEGELNNPKGVAFLNDTDLVIADTGSDRICIVNTATGTLVKTFGKRGNGDGKFEHPCGVAVDENDNIIVCDNLNHRVQVFTKDGDYQYQFGLTTQSTKFYPVDVIAHDGLFYVSDYQNHAIHVFEKKGDATTRISRIGGYGSADGQLSSSVVEELGPEGYYGFGSRTHRSFGLAIDKNHYLLVCDAGNNRIQRLTRDGRVVGKTWGQIESPVCITAMNDGQLLVTTSFGAVFCLK